MHTAKLSDRMQEYEIKPSRWLSIDLKELWRFRELFLYMAWRDIKVKYKQTLLGLFWVILQPLILMIIFNTIWLKVMKYSDPQIPYPLFAYCGLILWGLFSSGINNASESMISNSNIIKKVYFPRIIIPFSSIIVSFFDFMMTLVIFIIMIVYYKPDIQILNYVGLFILSILTILSASIGLGLIICSLTIKYRDFRYIIPFFLQAMFFLSPVVYPVSLFDSESLRLILSLNPVAGSINIARSALTNNHVDWSITSFSILIAILLLLSGLTIFRRMESKYSDLL